MNQKTTALFRRLLYGVIFGIVVYALFAIFSDLEALLETLQDFPLVVLLGACALTCVNYGVRFFKWHLYLRLLGLNVPWSQSLLIFLAGLIMAISPGKVGEVVKSLLLKRSFEIEIARTVPVILAERLTDLLGLFILVSLGVVIFAYGQWLFLLTLLCLLLGIAALQSRRLVTFFLDLVEALPFVGRLRPALDEAYDSTEVLLRPGPLSLTTVLSALAWSMEALAFAWILSALGVHAPLVLEAFFVFSASTLLGALSFLPGGLGVTEGSMTGLLLWLGLFEEISGALAATYLIRFTTLWFGVIVGILAFLYYERRQRLREVASPEVSPSEEG